jgi:Flp pilus assembly protein TadG
VRSTRKKTSRWAAVAVEMAVVTPLLLTLLFGMIEYGWVFTVRQALVTAAREGARTAALPGSTDADIQGRVTNYMAPLGLTTYHVTMTHSTTAVPVETVEIALPRADASLLGGYFGHHTGNMTASCSMRKEGLD